MIFSVQQYSLAKSPLFSAITINIIFFFSQLIIKKSGQSGQRIMLYRKNRLKNAIFGVKTPFFALFWPIFDFFCTTKLSPLFFSKVGKSPLFFGQNAHYLCCTGKINPKIFGLCPLFKSKNGQNYVVHKN